MKVEANLRLRRACGSVQFTGSNPGTELNSPGTATTAKNGTVCGWFYQTQFGGVSVHQYDTGNPRIIWQAAANGTTTFFTGASGTLTLFTALLNTWYFYALTLGATNTIAYVRQITTPFTIVTATSDSASGASVIGWGADGATFGDGAMVGSWGGGVIYSRPLSRAEVWQQSLQRAPITESGLEVYASMRNVGAAALNEFKGSQLTKVQTFAAASRSPPVPEIAYKRAFLFLSQAASVGLEEGRGSLPQFESWDIATRQPNAPEDMVFTDGTSTGLEDSGAPRAFVYDDTVSTSPIGREDFAGFLTIDEPGQGAYQPPEPGAWLAVPTQSEDNAPSLTIDDSAGVTIAPQDAGWFPALVFHEEFAGSLPLDESPGAWAQSSEPAAWLKIPSQAPEDSAPSLTIDDPAGFYAWLVTDTPTWLSVSAQQEDNAPSLTVDDAAGNVAAALLEAVTLPSATQTEDFAGLLTIDDGAGASPTVSADAIAVLPVTFPEDAVTATTAGLEDGVGALATYLETAAWLSLLTAPEDMARLAAPFDESGPTYLPIDPPTWAAQSGGEEFAQSGATGLEEGPPAGWQPTDATIWIGASITEDIARATAPFDETGPAWTLVDLPTWTTSTSSEDFTTTTTTALDDGSSVAWPNADAIAWVSASISEDFATTTALDETAVATWQPGEISTWLGRLVLEDFAGALVTEEAPAYALVLPELTWLPYAITAEQFTASAALEEPPGASVIVAAQDTVATQATYDEWVAAPAIEEGSVSPSLVVFVADWAPLSVSEEWTAGIIAVDDYGQPYVWPTQPEPPPRIWAPYFSDEWVPFVFHGPLHLTETDQLLLQLVDTDQTLLTLADGGDDLATYYPGSSFRFSLTATVLGSLFTTTPSPVLTVHGPDNVVIQPTVTLDSTGKYHADGVIPFGARPGPWRRMWRVAGSDPSDSAVLVIAFTVQQLEF